MRSPRKISSLKIACILDEFSYESIKPNISLITFGPDNWKQVFKREQPDFLFVESAWKGNRGTWQYRIAKYSRSFGNELYDILNWCKKKHVPTIFWNKEDPIHYDRFINTAKHFEIICTTDSNQLENYKKIVKHNKVYPLLFAAQPQIHNPINSKREKKNVCFAGSFFNNRYPERRVDMINLLEAAMDFGLDIFDRNYVGSSNEKSNYDYPFTVQEALKGYKPYLELVEEYKNYKVFLNVNSVKTSPTMFSRRVFEILACGTPVISSYAEGIKRQFGSIVPTVSNKEEAFQALYRLIHDDRQRERISLQGQRIIFNHHTYMHRIQEVAEWAGFNIIRETEEKVIIFCIVRNDKEAEAVCDSFLNQVYPHKELIIGVRKENFEEISQWHQNKNRGGRICLFEDLYDFAEQMREKESYYSYFSPHHYYGPNFIMDFVHSRRYSATDYFTKNAYYSREGIRMILHNEAEENRFSSQLLVAASLVHGDNLAEYLNLVMCKPTHKYNLITIGNGKVYSTNKFHFVYQARDQNFKFGIPSDKLKSEVDL